MFKRLYETHLNVLDLDRSMEFYGDVLGLKLGNVDQSRRIAFYFIGGWNESMLGVWEKPPAQVLSQHIAFEVDLDQLGQTTARLAERGVELLDFFGRPSRVPTVFGWMPAAGVYFNDPDGHLLEVLARLPGIPQPELGLLTLDEWDARRKPATGAGD